MNKDQSSYIDTEIEYDKNNETKYCKNNKMKQK